MKQGKATVCSSCPHGRLFVRLYSQNNAMTFIKFDIGELFFPRFGTVVTVFGSKADDKRHCAHERNKILSKNVSSFRAPRNGYCVVHDDKNFRSLSGRRKCRRTSARWNSIYCEVYPESRGVTDLRVTKIEGSCRSRFFMIFQELPTEWMRLRVFRDGPGRANACAWHSRFNVNPLCRRQGEKEQTDKSDPSIRV